MEVTLAVKQRYFNKDSMGYFEILLIGDLAEAQHGVLKIGKKVSVQGSLWTRAYKNRQGQKVLETKILAESIGGQA